jgi:hypothetical protein
MKRSLMSVLLGSFCLGVVPAVSLAQRTPDLCAFDRAKMLALDERAFDQDLEGGWRTLGALEACWPVAADLIRDYRLARAPGSGILFWHEGQMRAFAGQSERAIPLFEAAREPANDGFGWNLYVDATVAFLNRDKPGLLVARAALAHIPKPDGVELSYKDAQGRVIEFTWPPNLDVIDDLIRCFDRPYKDAYGCSMR